MTAGQDVSASFPDGTFGGFLPSDAYAVASGRRPTMAERMTTNIALKRQYIDEAASQMS